MRMCVMGRGGSVHKVGDGRSERSDNILVAPSSSPPPPLSLLFIFTIFYMSTASIGASVVASPSASTSTMSR